jgi:hypothetical protein
MVQFRDAEAATTLGWLWLQAKDPASAGLWFSRARTWAPSKVDATRGLAFASLAERDYDRALQLASDIPDGPEVAAMRRDARVGLAERHYRSERYVDAAATFESAERDGEMPRYARALHAWSLASQGRRDDALARFAALYREQPDLESAQGLMAAARAQPLDPSLAATEPLATLLRRREGATAFGHRRFLEARALDEASFGNLGAVTTAHATLSAATRDKSGGEGESRLRQRDATTLAAYVPLDAPLAIRAAAGRETIDAGSSATREQLSSAEITLRLERTLVIEAAAGRAAQGGPVGARTTARLEVAATPRWGQASAALSTQPVRESVLAYAGVRDASGTRGRVFRTALEGRVLRLDYAPWSLAARAAIARLDGEDVERNDYTALEAAIGRDLGLENFAYAAASIAASDERFDRNLSGFGPGQGGYFSPQRYRRIGAAFDFMTAERSRWIVRGRAAAGHVWKREDDRASRGGDATLQLSGVIACTPHIHAGFALAHGRSPQYRETQALLQVQVLQRPAMTVASADLPVLPR